MIAVTRSWWNIHTLSHITFGFCSMLRSAMRWMIASPPGVHLSSRPCPTFSEPVSRASMIGMRGPATCLMSVSFYDGRPPAVSESLRPRDGQQFVLGSPVIGLQSIQLQLWTRVLVEDCNTVNGQVYHIDIFCYEGVECTPKWMQRLLPMEHLACLYTEVHVVGPVQGSAYQVLEHRSLLHMR